MAHTIILFYRRGTTYGSILHILWKSCEVGIRNRKYKDIRNYSGLNVIYCQWCGLFFTFSPVYFLYTLWSLSSLYFVEFELFIFYILQSLFYHVIKEQHTMISVAGNDAIGTHESFSWYPFCCTRN